MCVGRGGCDTPNLLSANGPPISNCRWLTQAQASPRYSNTHNPAGVGVGAGVGAHTFSSIKLVKKFF